MQVNKVGMIRNHFEPGNTSRIRMVVIHSTAAVGPGDFNYLRNGGSDENPVSIHYYIGKNGAISQMVDDQNIAWQAGVSAWRVDGRATTSHAISWCATSISPRAAKPTRLAFRGRASWMKSTVVAPRQARRPTSRPCRRPRRSRSRHSSSYVSCWSIWPTARPVAHTRPHGRC